MGYGYGHASSGRTALACDKCGQVGGVRKRRCPYVVRGHSAYGARHSLPYCPAPALCNSCYRELGGLRGVHGDACAEGAAKSQAADDAIQARLDAGDVLVTWARAMEGCMVRVGCSDGSEWEVAASEYRRGGFITDYPGASKIERSRC